MKELFELSFAAENIVPTILLLAAVAYWLVFLVGLLDLGFLDLHLDHSADVHADAHLDVHHDVHADAGKEVHGAQKSLEAAGQSFGARLMEFFNLGHVPFMVVFSMFALFFWAASVLGNYYLGSSTVLMVLAVLGGAFVTAALMSKVVTQPLRRLFRKLYQDEGPTQLEGRVAVIEVGPQDQLLGQATLRVGFKELTINVRSDDGKRIPPGVQVAILEHVPDQDYYLVSPLEADTSEVHST